MRPFASAITFTLAVAASCAAQIHDDAQHDPANPPASVETPAVAGGPPQTERRGPPDFFELTLRTAYLFDAGVSDRGSVSVSSVAARFGVRYPVSRELVLGLSIGTGALLYDFDGPSKLVPGDQSPWDSIRVSSVGASAFWRREDWTALGALNISSAGEDGADFDDTLTWGGSLIVTYAVSPTLSIGAGVTGQTKLDDNPFVLPFPTLDWVLPGDPQQRWRLQVGGQRLGPSRAAAAGITFAPSDDLSFAAGVTAVGLGGEFRLDDDGPAPGGVGRDSSFPALVAIEWNPRAGVEVNAYGGVAIGQELELLDSEGVRLSRRNVRPAPLVGLTVNLSF